MNVDFVNRIKRVMEHYELGVSAFADKIAIQRSSMSHILSGRNRPSLDFVMKVVNTFPEVNLYWLLNGKGSFPNESVSFDSSSSPSSTEIESLKKEKEEIKTNLGSSTNKTLSKIVFFYSDGTFETFTQKKN